MTPLRPPPRLSEVAAAYRAHNDAAAAALEAESPTALSLRLERARRMRAKGVR